MKTLHSSAHQQYGAALPIALIMLLISTMVGLSAIRSSSNQEKMSSNMYDRSLAYQAAEAALRAAEDEILRSPKPEEVGKDCIFSGKDGQKAPSCPTIPDQTFTGDGSNDIYWKTVENATFHVNTARLDESTKPQYYIERVGIVGGTDELGTGSSANCDNYAGCDQTSQTAMLYRVTARSGKPSEHGRSIVVLQTNVKQNL
jgi:type IV pilus assembly protein PilX